MIKVSILGGSGYAGGELLRILLQHPEVEIGEVTSRRFAGRPVSTAHPNLRKATPLKFTHPDSLSACDVLLVALPNGESMHLMPELLTKASKVIDLGADFRLNDPQVFQDWYGAPHASPELLAQFTYGLAELRRQEIKKTKYLAGGGCEATVSILALYPLVQANLIKPNIIIDAKMSSSQSGMDPSPASHHPERAGCVRSYMPTGHRHTAEIVQELAGGKKLDIAVSATALDMVRGLLVTIHTAPRRQVTEKDIWKTYRQFYGDEPFIRIVKEQRGIYRFPEPKILQGSNYCDIGFELDRRSNRLVVIAAIDNLVKGTAGQAVQAMNLMCGFEETLGLLFPGLHPI
ncbi:MAG: N-acetyl-gamma-glutamyl-phosphate reductase [Candidatus Pacebacteria bacterium CG10_big_fil_rev_8_21_14_0_10_56_10]|nr:MAG: N-acetyl-gamma-glutamyl-phosphate reductase [Candidatus Pacebacteria bacterium CG10_big_fil_rev_8_21_14_0_10_56_10]